MTTLPADTLAALIAGYSSGRNITEILHFTTTAGLVGILATGAVQSRDLLEEESYLEHIYTPNCRDRLKDAEWTRYVNLSISRVNARMLGSSQSWHPISDDLWWAVLAFDPVILADPGVWFTTTNNTYPTVRRGQGLSGLHSMYAERVAWGRYGSVLTREPSTPTHWTTDPQAEVLYPEQLSTAALKGIYVFEPEHVDVVCGLLDAMPVAPKVAVVHNPEVFQ